MKIISYCLLLSGLGFLQTSAWAASYQATTVHSVYRDPATKTWQSPKEWLFRQDSPGIITISGQLDAPPLLRLSYDEATQVTTISKKLQRGAGEIFLTEYSTGLILSAGFPAPYDDLGPLTTLNEPISLKNTVCDVTFSSSATRTVESISLADALTAGMLADESTGLSASQELTLITLLKSGILEVRQLWNMTEPFWLYEETPLRKSWRTSLTLSK